MRWWIFHAEKNGFAQVIVRVGGRLYIDRDAFNNWLEMHRDEPIPEGEPDDDTSQF